MPPIKHQRRIKLIKPKLQLRLVGKFFGLAVLGLLLQFLLLGRLLPSAVAEAQAAGGTASDALPGVLIQVLLSSALILFPILLFFGVLFTFRIAGPIHRFERFLRAVVDGEQTLPCKIREGDEFYELCELLNSATAPLREAVAGERDLDQPENEGSEEQPRAAGQDERARRAG